MEFMEDEVKKLWGNPGKGCSAKGEEEEEV